MKSDFSNLSDKQVLRKAKKFVKKLDRYLKSVRFTQTILSDLAELSKKFPHIPIPPVMPPPNNTRVKHWTQEREYWSKAIQEGTIK